jgi:hypothetical protein
MYNELKSIIKEIKKNKYENLSYISYSEYVAESIDKSIKYSDYLAEQNYLDTSISYYEYK